ncbi:putative cytochrome P450 phenylacetate 2-hydroxylase [Xylogone sp. PMI_703]|nr:putative cytochrome P450 phenylacetate 2-hydroxylase [Xylogone sp. PMI_703]
MATPFPIPSQLTITHPAILFFIAASIIALAIRWSNKTDIPKIKGLPELPGVPMFGSLFLLGKHHARNCAKLAQTYGDVFQRFIYANSFEAVRELWIKNQSALISRPRFWTFHDVVSETQGVFTLGTSPWNESVKRARKAAATALNRQAVQTYLPFIDLESTASINELFQNARHTHDIDPNSYFQRFSLNISLTLNYGLRIQGTVRDNTLNEVVQVERELGNIRGIAHNWQDYVPLLRLWPGFKANAIKFRGRRDEYILSFLEQLKERIANGTDRPCIAGNVLKDPEAKLADSKHAYNYYGREPMIVSMIDELHYKWGNRIYTGKYETLISHELKSICLTMVAAGLDTLPGNINMTIAYLSSPHGQEIQERLYEELIQAYPNEDPWHACLVEEKSEFMQSFIKEVLRFWSTLNLSFNRESIKDINYKGANIPAGTPFLMNMWAANRDPQHFESPMEFVPDRFMGISEVGAGTQHYGYGAGTRMCAGSHLANRELYAIFTRLILAFHIRETTELKDRPILDSIECNSVPTSMVTQPKPFKVKFIPRNSEQLDVWIKSSIEKTSYL